MTAKEKAARKRLTAAMKAYSRAVKQLEKAIGATEEELDDARESVWDLHNDDRHAFEPDFGEPYWDAIALDYVLENREFAKEDAEEEAKRTVPTASEVVRARQTGVSVEQLRKETKEAKGRNRKEIVVVERD